MILVMALQRVSGYSIAGMIVYINEANGYYQGMCKVQGLLIVTLNVYRHSDQREESKILAITKVN